jgi:hypothetical protein
MTLRSSRRTIYTARTLEPRSLRPSIGTDVPTVDVATSRRPSVQSLRITETSLDFSDRTIFVLRRSPRYFTPKIPPIIPRIAPYYQLNRLPLAGMFPGRSRERQASGNSRCTVRRHRGLFDVQQDSAAYDAVEHASGGVGERAVLRLQGCHR